MASVDSVADNTGFAQKNAATFPILADPTKTTAKSLWAYWAATAMQIDGTFYIDAEGLIVAIDKAVQPRTAGQQLVANLEALKVPRADSR